MTPADTQFAGLGSTPSRTENPNPASWREREGGENGKANLPHVCLCNSLFFVVTVSDQWVFVENCAENSVELQGVCVCVCVCVSVKCIRSLGSAGQEKGLARVSGQSSPVVKDFFNPPPLVLKARGPTMLKPCSYA